MKNSCEAGKYGGEPANRKNELSVDFKIGKSH